MFDLECRHCPRLARHLDEVRERYPEYYARPVPAFGPLSARLLIVGLAPGMHGANATGRPFTGDYAGILRYRVLYQLSFSNQAESFALGDGLELNDCRITNAVKCLPPQNRPVTAEVKTCNRYLKAELDRLVNGAVILALGAIAHNAVLRALSLSSARLPFAHAKRHRLEGNRWLLDSYHCSRYNTQTRRLTEAMFLQVVGQARELLDGSPQWCLAHG